MREALSAPGSMASSSKDTRQPQRSRGHSEQAPAPTASVDVGEIRTASHLKTFRTLLMAGPRVSETTADKEQPAELGRGQCSDISSTSSYIASVYPGLPGSSSAGSQPTLQDTYISGAMREIELLRRLMVTISNMSNASKRANLPIANNLGSENSRRSRKQLSASRHCNRYEPRQKQAASPRICR